MGGFGSGFRFKVQEGVCLILFLVVPLSGNVYHYSIIEVYVIYSIQRRCYCTWMARRRDGVFGIAVA